MRRFFTCAGHGTHKTSRAIDPAYLNDIARVGGERLFCVWQSYAVLLEKILPYFAVDCRVEKVSQASLGDQYFIQLTQPLTLTLGRREGDNVGYDLGLLVLRGASVVCHCLIPP